MAGAETCLNAVAIWVVTESLANAPAFDANQAIKIVVGITLIETERIGRATVNNHRSPFV